MQKYFFFAITILFVTGFVSIPVHADDTTTRYRDYSITDHGDGTKTNTFGLPEYVWNGNQFVDRIIGNNGTHFNVYSEMGSFSFDKNDCTITQYVKGFDPISQTAHGSDVVIGDWFWTIARKNGANPWEVIDPTIFGCSISTSQNSTGKYLTMTRTHPSTGSYLKVTLAAPNGKQVEDFNELYMNVPAWNGNKFAFVLWAKNVNTNSLTFRNGTTIQIPAGQTTLDRSQLTVNSMDFIKNGNAFYFDWQKAQPQFKTLILNKTGSILDVQFGFNNNAVTLNTGQKLFLDPTYGYTAVQSQQSVYTAATTQCYGAVGTTNNTAASTTYAVRLPSTGAADNCVIQVGKFIITSIPDSATIISANFRHDHGGTASANPIKLVARNMTADPQGSASSATKFLQGTQGNFVISPWTEAAPGTNDIVQPFNSNGTTAIQNQLTANWFGMALSFVSMRSDASAHNISDLQNWELEVTYSAAPPNPVTTLAASGTTTTTTDLSWTAPNMNGGTLQRYVLNYTTPCGTPNTHLANGTTATSYTVSGLTLDTCYSFRVSAATEAGYNISGANIVNVTTLAFNQANYTIGGFNFNANNPVLFPIRYERIDNGTSTYVNVTFSNTINLACDLRYTYAGTNHTYHTISSIPISSTEKEAQFRFTNSSNDITTFHCWNQAGNQSANYVLTQTDFLLKQQVRDFRNGTYGTMGQFGAFDLITLIIVIISMIGLNRNTEAVAGIFCIMAISVLAYFEIVSWITAIVSAACVILLFIVAGTKKT